MNHYDGQGQRGNDGNNNPPFMVFMKKYRNYPMCGTLDTFPGVACRTRPNGWIYKNLCHSGSWSGKLFMLYEMDGDDLSMWKNEMATIKRRCCLQLVQ